MSYGQLGGYHQHTAAIGDLMASLWAAGQVELRHGSDDPQPGVESISSVMAQLDTAGLTNVVSLDAAGRHITVQSKCPLGAAEAQAKSEGLGLPVDWTKTSKSITAGAALLRGLIQAESVSWVDVVTRSGQLTRHQANQLPPDALLLALRIQLT
ncbi:MAG: FAD-dependent oxidoreductase [Micrococcales bacterium]|nr:FAD-dependent oxidoreductase [Micrococcales bacterium]